MAAPVQQASSKTFRNCLLSINWPSPKSEVGRHSRCTDDFPQCVPESSDGGPLQRNSSKTPATDSMFKKEGNHYEAAQAMADLRIAQADALAATAEQCATGKMPASPRTNLHARPDKRHSPLIASGEAGVSKRKRKECTAVSSLDGSEGGPPSIAISPRTMSKSDNGSFHHLRALLVAEVAKDREEEQQNQNQSQNSGVAPYG
ncbi:hypothetical protein LTR16_002869 [Cryomyces antarcticus]|uniref:Uncharacterized protein n=1 Tax=Cryomyces antarcticus TaxID=329879 RepID=A0ABR0LPF5_9PEZI|nr:hypothetical protein LTR16_002869 [Cryomyces antarcticus]